MKITERSVELVNAPDYETLLDTVTKAGHNCYKAETVDTQEHKEKFIRGIIKRGHEAVLEFSNIDVHIVADRSFMGQLTRHRLMHFCIESARYNNYASDKNGNEIAVIVPADIDENSREFETWYRGCVESENSYMDLIATGVKPETARSVLPMCLATSIFCGANIREWRHIFRLRCDSHAQIDIRLVMTKLLALMYEKYTVFFEDLAKEFGVVQGKPAA
jgi:thymidylate synthase (FAD)